MATAIMIQKESGGNLAEVLDKTSYVIRERFRLKRQIRTHTAQGRLTGWILSLLPVVLGIALFMVNPAMMSILWTREIGVETAVGFGRHDVAWADSSFARSSTWKFEGDVWYLSVIAFCVVFLLIASGGLLLFYREALPQRIAEAINPHPKQRSADDHDPARRAFRSAAWWSTSSSCCPRARRRSRLCCSA